MAKPIPIEVNHIRAQEKVRITWNDDHLWEYPLNYLRGYCPCALCQGHGASETKKFVSVPEVKLREIRPVGNYALEFCWEDGHSTGIYSFDYLRSLCGCSQCEQAQAGS